MNVGKDHDRLSREAIHRRVIGRWENEGGSVRNWHRDTPVEEHSITVAGEIGDAEAANTRVRLIAIENIIVALLADAPDDRLELIREMATFISPRPSKTPHRLTVEAARTMVAMVERAKHYRTSRGRQV